FREQLPASLEKTLSQPQVKLLKDLTEPLAFICGIHNKRKERSFIENEVKKTFPGLALRIGLQVAVLQFCNTLHMERTRIDETFATDLFNWLEGRDNVYDENDWIRYFLAHYAESVQVAPISEDADIFKIKVAVRFHPEEERTVRDVILGLYWKRLFEDNRDSLSVISKEAGIHVINDFPFNIQAPTTEKIKIPGKLVHLFTKQIATPKELGRRAKEPGDNDIAALIKKIMEIPAGEEAFLLEKLKRNESREFLFWLADARGYDTDWGEAGDQLLDLLEDTPLSILLVSPYLEYGAGNLVRQLQKEEPAATADGVKSEGLAKSFSFSYRTVAGTDSGELLKTASLFPAGFSREDAEKVRPGFSSNHYSTLEMKHFFKRRGEDFHMASPLGEYAFRLWLEKNSSTSGEISREAGNWIDLISRQAVEYKKAAEGKARRGGEHLPNIYFCLDFLINCFDVKQAPEIYDAVFKILENIIDFLLMSGKGTDVERYLDIAWEMTGMQEDKGKDAFCALSLGDIYFADSRNKDAEGAYETAAELYRQLGGVLNEARSLVKLGKLYRRESRNADAATVFEAALPLFRLTGSMNDEADCLVALGELHRSETSYPEAIGLIEAALELYRKSGNSFGEAGTLKRLGDIHMHEYRNPEAKELYDAARQLFNKILDLRGEAGSLLSLGQIDYFESRYAEAWGHFDAALQLYKIRDDSIGMADSYQWIGNTYLRENQYKTAEGYFSDALQLYRDGKDIMGEGQILRRLGEVHFFEGRIAEAKQQFEDALPLFKKIDYALGEADILLRLGNFYFADNNAKDAKEAFESALRLYREKNNSRGEADVLSELALVSITADKIEDGKAKLNKALALYKKINDRYSAAAALEQFALFLGRIPPWENEADGILREASRIYYDIGLLDRVVKSTYIKHVRLRNYRTIRDTKIDFQPGLNIIIGKNGVGKSNFLKYLNNSIDFNRKSEELDARVSFADSFIEDFDLAVDLHRSTRSSKKNGGPVVESDHVSINIYKNKEPLHQYGNYTEFYEFLNRAKFFYLPVLVTHGLPTPYPMVQEKEKYFFKLDDTGAKEESKKPDTGSYFLSSITGLIINRGLDLFDGNVKTGAITEKDVAGLIQAAVDILSPTQEALDKFTDIADIRFNKGYNITVDKNKKGFSIYNLFLEFKVEGHWLPFSHLSDGTQRLFYMMSEISTPISRGLNKLVLLEEPELGLHPRQLHAFLQFLTEASGEHQIIVTTHAPQVLDILDEDQLNRIIIARLSKQGTKLRHLTRKEREKAALYMEEAFLSDYWRYSDLED
ncbi:MAG: tetratricopeptide repeat protein, partial [bacterium]|nr:tetratricopeptide repeat protein [bacterium]